MPTVCASSSITGITPVQSNAKSTVDPVISRTCSTRSDERELIVCVAPNSRASCKAVVVDVGGDDLGDTRVAGRHDRREAHRARRLPRAPSRRAAAAPR